MLQCLSYLQSMDPVKIITVRTTAFEADESQGGTSSEVKMDAPGITYFCMIHDRPLHFCMIH